MKLPYTTLDVFTNTRFSGNPLAIVRIPSTLIPSLSESQKQQIAIEFNFSETVFLHEPSDPSSSSPVLYDIFTPKARIPFAGHPTIGTAVYLSSIGRPSWPGTTWVRELTTPMVGDVPFDWDESEGKASATVPFELREHETRMPHPMPGAETNPGGVGDCPIVSIVKGMSFILVPLSDLPALSAASTTGFSGSIINPQRTYLAEYLDSEDGWNTGLTNTMFFVITGRNGREIELRTRVIGRMEDPGTGSASCALAAWLASREVEGGDWMFRLVQGVEMGRRNEIEVRVRKEMWTGLKRITGVRLRGAAVRVMEGEIEV